MSEQRIKHLLLPKEFKSYCLPNKSAGTLDVTTKPSEATCANCLTLYRRKHQGKHSDFKVAHVAGSRAYGEHDSGTPRCAICGARIYLESPAEGYYCPSCGSSDSDE